jgi:hypothetical protein
MVCSYSLCTCSLLETWNLLHSYMSDLQLSGIQYSETECLASLVRAQANGY